MGQSQSFSSNPFMGSKEQSFFLFGGEDKGLIALTMAVILDKWRWIVALITISSSTSFSGFENKKN